jgi:hypothetical protein
MASRIEQPVVNSTDTSGSATFVVEDYKRWTGRIGFTVTGGGTPAFTYAVKLMFSASDTSSTSYVLKSGTVATGVDVLINNNDGDGGEMTVYGVIVEWSGMAEGVVNAGMRKSY